MFTLAHFTDPHIGPLPQPSWRELMGKRLSGYLSWTRNRHNIHNMGILKALTDDIMAHKPDHIALTGDIINISLTAEFRNAADWMASVAPPEHMSVVPGNHDAYVRVPYEEGLGLWDGYMSSHDDAAAYLPSGHKPFPWLRLFGKVAMVGLSSAQTTLPFVAGGRVGKRQLRLLADLLERLGANGFFRVVLIHHPPLPGLNSRRKGLWDAGELQEVFLTRGAELVLHGHNHRHMITTLQGSDGPVAVAGGPSASARKTGRRPGAGYFLFDIDQQNGSWQCGVRVRNLSQDNKTFEDGQALFAPLVYG